MLIRIGADVNAKVNVHSTPLWIALPNASVDLIQLLLSRGANPNTCRIIIVALNRKTDKLEVLKLLVEHGVDVNEVFELEGTGTWFTALDWTTDPEI